MKEIIRNLRKFIDADAQLKEDQYSLNFSAADKRNFKLYRLEIAQTSLLLIYPLRELRPSFIIDAVSSLSVDGILLPTRNRFLTKLAISKRINVVSPGLLFLPSANCVLNPSSESSSHETTSSRLTPNEQLILLKLLYDTPGSFLVGELASSLGITNMTVFRALKRFSGSGVSYTCEGPRNNLHRFSVEDYSRLYSSLKERLLNPCFKTVFVNEALLRKDVLLETGVFGKNIGDEEFPDRPIKGIYKKEVGALEGALISEEEGGTMVLVLNYDAKRVALKNDIDPITLSLLFPNADESVSKAIRAWLKSYSWYK